MPRSPDPGGRAARALTAILSVALLGAFGYVLLDTDEDAPVIRTQDAILDVLASPGSSNRVQLDVTLYQPESTPAPAILLPHGFGGSKQSVVRDARELAGRGFVVLTYSARGFGQSTGSISLNDPDYEVADAGHLIDYLARQPAVAMDSPGDPKVAVTGSSYAGALALLVAGTDRRVDAIAPVMTYNDLAQGLLPNAGTTEEFAGSTPAHGVFSPNGVFKKAWAGNLFAGGVGSQGNGAWAPDAPEPGSEPDDDTGQGAAVGDSGESAAAGNGGERTATPGNERRGPAAPCGRFSPEVCGAYTELATTGSAGEQTTELLRRVSPASITHKISIPTLLVQGEQDTLFGLDQADATARQITQAGGDVQLVWYAGGHDGGGPGPQLRGKIADWLWFQLSGTGSNPLPAFSYDVQGAFQATRAPSVRIVRSDSYPGLRGPDASREPLTLSGDEQTILNPPGGNPAAVSGIPGAGAVVGRSSSLTSLLGIDLPGQSAVFTSPALTDQIVITGSSTVRLRIAARSQPGGQTGGRDAVLFVKLYDIGPDGRRTLPGSAVAPVRVADLPADGSPREVTVSLPGIVRPVDAGRRLQLVVATTDQAYANAQQPAAFRVSLAADGVLQVPVVPGTAASSGWPVGQLLGIAGVLLAAGAVAAFAAFRRRLARNVDAELADTPLVIENLTKSYPGGLTAVSELSFRVERGQVLGLLGPNGAGKTTTLRMLMGLITPTAGDIRVFGHRIHPGAPVLSRIGSFVEGSGFLPHQSGKANLQLYWDSTGRPGDKAHFTEALEIAGLGDSVHRKVRTYSQGMRQRLAIAQAMLGLPELLVLDEPTNGLDPPQIHQMREVLRRYAATGRTVLVSSHLLAEVEQTSTHVVVMHRGKVVADGAVGEIVAAGGEASFIVDQPMLAADTLRTIEGVSDIDTNGATVHANLAGMPRSVAVAALVQAGVSVEQAGPRRRLEDAFLQLVGDTGEGRE
ncbi:MAG: alpha/beta fold hydrolase [Haloechinothrix sp.]